MQRRSVDLPDPRGHMMPAVPPRMICRSMSVNTSCAPKRFTTPRNSTAGVGAILVTGQPHNRGVFFSAMDEPLDASAESPIKQGGEKEGLEWDEIIRLHRICCEGELGNRDNRQECRVLDQLNQLIADHGSDGDQDLRQDDSPEQLQPCKPERVRGFRLARGKVRPSATKNFGHVGGVVSDERDQSGAPLVDGESERRKREVYERRRQQEWHAPS